MGKVLFAIQDDLHQRLPHGRIGRGRQLHHVREPLYGGQ